MKFWMKYRRGTSASSGNWAWVMLSSETREQADEDAKSFAEEINQSYYWSEHHRGVEWEIETEAPKHIVDARLKDTIAAIERLNDDLIRLAEEAKTAKVCECKGAHTYSCYCDICGKVLPK